MVIGLLDRASYAIFRSVASREIHAWLEFFFVKRRIRMFGHKSWHQWIRLASLALLGDSYLSIFDDYWDANPLVETQFHSYAMVYMECEIFQNPGIFDDPRIRDVVRDYEQLSVDERRLFVYHCIIMTRYVATGHSEVLRVHPLTHSVALFVYDESCVPKDANQHYLVAISNDAMAPKIDLRGLRYCQTELACANDTVQAINCVYHLFQSFVHHMKGNLYGIGLCQAFPLNLDTFIRSRNDRAAFKASLQECYASLFTQKEERFLTRGKSFISRYMICRDLIYGVSR